MMPSPLFHEHTGLVSKRINGSQFNLTNKAKVPLVAGH